MNTFFLKLNITGIYISDSLNLRTFVISNDVVIFCLRNEMDEHYFTMCKHRVKDCHALHRTFNVQPIYLRHENTGE